MAAGTWSTGAVYVFADPPLNGTRDIYFLGIGKQAPQSRHQKVRIDIQNDSQGSSADRMHAGQTAQTSWTVTKADLAAIEIMEAVPGPLNGHDTIETMGALLEAEDFFFNVWFLFARRNVAAMVARSMQKGRRYPYSELLSWEPIDGVRENAAAITFQHNQIWTPQSERFVLYDFDTTQVEGLAVDF